MRRRAADEVRSRHVHPLPPHGAEVARIPCSRARALGAIAQPRRSEVRHPGLAQAVRAVEGLPCGRCSGTDAMPILKKVEQLRHRGVRMSSRSICLSLALVCRTRHGMKCGAVLCCAVHLGVQGMVRPVERLVLHRAPRRLGRLILELQLDLAPSAVPTHTRKALRRTPRLRRRRVSHRWQVSERPFSLIASSSASRQSAYRPSAHDALAVAFAVANAARAAFTCAGEGVPSAHKSAGGRRVHPSPSPPPMCDAMRCYASVRRLLLIRRVLIHLLLIMGGQTGRGARGEGLNTSLSRTTR